MPTINIKQENVTYIAMWLLLFSTPMLILIIHASSNSNLDIDWWTIIHIEEILGIYFVAFLVHNFLLAPMLLYKQQTGRYVCSILILVVAFIALQSWIRPIMHGQKRHRPRAENVATGKLPPLIAARLYWLILIPISASPGL